MLQKQKFENSGTSTIQSRVKIIGYYANHIDQESHIQIGDPENVIHAIIQSEMVKNKPDKLFMPKQIATYNHAIAVIDIQNKLWAILDLSNEPICISSMLKMKIWNVSLHYYEMMIKGKESWYVLSWSNKRKMKEDRLQKVPIQNIKHKYYTYFQLFKIKGSTPEDSFQYSTYKQYFSESEIYQIKNKQYIIANPYHMSQISKIAGISIGKYHNLCWNEEGKLYSWGLKSIALGYSYSPDEEIITNPRQVSLMKGFVLKAYACVNYSLAVTLEGKVYQWGINKLYSQKDQAILEPQEVPIDTNSKVVNLKGNNQKYGAVTLQGELFVWGKNMKQIIGQEQNTPTVWEKSILYPMAINKNIGFIIDFQISQGYIILISLNKNIFKFSSSHEDYWNRMKETIRENLREPYRIKLKDNNNNKMNNCSSQNKIRFNEVMRHRKGNNHIEDLFYKKQSKQEYIHTAHQEEKILEFIMRKDEKENSLPKENQLIRFDGFNTRERYSEMMTKAPNMKTLRMNTAMDEFNSTFAKQKEYIKLLSQTICPVKEKHSTKEFKKIFRVTKLADTKKVRNQKDYNSKMETIKKKRDEIESTFRETTFKKVQNNSFQIRIIKKQQLQQQRKIQREILIYKLSLQKFLIKGFIVKLMSKSTVVGRQAKISNFARHLKLQRIERNIRSLFIKYSIKLKLKKLQTKQMYRFFLLTLCFQQYVKAFRAKKVKRHKKYIVNQIFKYLIKEKIKVGITTCNFNVKKLQKFKEWLSMVKMERIKCLKYVWKINLLSMMSVNSAHESTTIIYLPKNIDQINFQMVYKERIGINPLLRLTNFLNKYSIFRIKATYFQKLISLFKSEGPYKMKAINTYNNKKARIKFYDDEEDKIDKYNLMQTDIFPHSIHYNLLIHPKNYDLTIPQIMKHNEKWIREEKHIFEIIIFSIIDNHEKKYLSARKAYDIDLAKYIKANYEMFAEKRWRYIIEFNKIERSFERMKMQRQLRRLMRLIGAEHIIDEDCIPQKHIVLEQAIKRVDAPKIPKRYIQFSTFEFKKQFKYYFDKVSQRIRQLRKNG